MQVPGPFEYERATSVDHAIGLLDRLGEGAMVVAGGHSLLPMMKLRIANPEYLVDINDLAAELGYVVGRSDRRADRRDDPAPRSTGVRCAGRSVPDLPRCRTGHRRSGGAQSRHGGWLAVPGRPRRGPDHGLRACSARSVSPAARRGFREIAIDDFLTGPYETSLAHNEILVEIRIPLRANSSSAYAKVERRVGDWAVTAAGAAVTLDGDQIVAARIGLTAVNGDAAGLAAVGESLPATPRPTRCSPKPAGVRRMPATGNRHAGHRRVQAPPRQRAGDPNAA